MDKEKEKKIVRSFFVPRLRDRVIYELSSSKKRKHALGRLCHQYKETLRSEYFIDISNEGSDEALFIKLLKENGATSTCYVLSWDEEIDGKELPLSVAMKKAMSCGMPSLIICEPGNIGYFQAEQEVLPTPRFLLKRPL